MATCLCSALALAALLQTPLPPPPSDSLAAVRAQLDRDSSDGHAWLAAGRWYLRLAEEAHAGEHRALPDSVATRAALDTADQALARAARLLGAAGAAAEGDSARVLRVGAWSARTRLAWEARGSATGPQEWGPPPLDLKLPPVLDELGENLLRACPMWGVLLTAREADSYAAWYMRHARGLRPDLLIVPLDAWRSDSALRARLATDLRLAHGQTRDGWLAELVKHRPVCISMGLERPPDTKPRVGWVARPLVWVAGPHMKDDRVPPRDFVFAALRIALDRHDPWAVPALAVYARAGRATPALCDAMRTFRVAAEVPACRR